MNHPCTGRNSGKPVRLAACIGGTSTSLAALDEQSRILERKSIPTSSGGPLMEACKAADDRLTFTLDHWSEFEIFRHRFLDALGHELEALADQCRKAGHKVQGLGVSAPGAIHPHTGEVLGRTGALNLPAWGEFNLQEALAARTGWPVRAINDAKAMALGALARITQDCVEFPGQGNVDQGHGEVDQEGESLLGSEGRRVRDFIELDPGTGLGGAYMVDGKLWFGPCPTKPDPDVGEIWKLKPDPNQPGVHWEELVSGRATWKRTEARCLNMAEEDARPRLKEADSRIQTLLTIASPEIQKIIEEELTRTGRYLALGIQYLITREQPRLKHPPITTFMIGGGPVSGQTPESQKVRALLHRSITRNTPTPIRLLFTTLGSKAGLHGSAALLDIPQ